MSASILFPAAPTGLRRAFLPAMAAGAGVAAAILTLAFIQMESQAAGPSEAAGAGRAIPALVELNGVKHTMRAPGGTLQGETVRYDPGVIAAFHTMARDYPVTLVNAPATLAFSLDAAAGGDKPVALASVDVLPPRRPAEFRQPPAFSPVAAAAAEPLEPFVEADAEPRILNIRVPGLGLARDAVATTGHVVTVTKSQASALVGRSLDAGLHLFKR